MRIEEGEMRGTREGLPIRLQTTPASTCMIHVMLPKVANYLSTVIAQI